MNHLTSEHVDQLFSRAREISAALADSNRLEQCPHCGKYYRRLARHMQKHIPNFQEYTNTPMQQQHQAPCELCPNSFHNNKTHFEDHLKEHVKGAKLFICEICKKGFAQNCNLINHLRVHTGDKPFKCNYCEKRFTQSGNLKNHMRLHNDEKPFICSICFQGFRQLSNLNNHSKKHPNFKESQFKRAKSISLST